MEQLEEELLNGQRLQGPATAEEVYLALKAKDSADKYVQVDERILGVEGFIFTVGCEGVGGPYQGRGAVGRDFSPSLEICDSRWTFHYKMSRGKSNSLLNFLNSILSTLPLI